MIKDKVPGKPEILSCHSKYFVRNFENERNFLKKKIGIFKQKGQGAEIAFLHLFLIMQVAKIYDPQHLWHLE